jgi:hypothetical protein
MSPRKGSVPAWVLTAVASKAMDSLPAPENSLPASHRMERPNRTDHSPAETPRQNRPQTETALEKSTLADWR